MAILAGFGALEPAHAVDWKFGFEAVQVRDKSFSPFEGGLSDAWHVGGYQGVDTLRVEAAVTKWTNTDLLFGGRIGQESGDLENVSVELWDLEPLAGIRRRYEVRERIEVYGQATLSLPYMRMSFDGPRPEKYWAVFPMLTPAVGAVFYPYVEGRSDMGLTLEAGYGTPAPMNFSTHKGVSPGTLDYGGLTYGIFLTWRGAPEAEPVRGETTVTVKPGAPESPAPEVTTPSPRRFEAPAPVTSAPAAPIP